MPHPAGFLLVAQSSGQARYRVPTMMVRSRCGVYVLTGRLDLLQTGTPSDEFRLRRVP